MSELPDSPVFITRLLSALFFDRRGTINPAGGVQIFCMGEVAVLFSLLGPGFYENVAVRGLEAFEQQGLKYVYASVSDAHLRLMRGKLSKVDVAFQFKNRTGGHLMNWVLITAKVEADPSPLPEKTMTTDAEKLESAVALLRRLKSSLMHTRRFSPDTLGHWRMACTQTEGDVEEWLTEHGREPVVIAPAPTPSAWINYKVIQKDGEVVGHEAGEVSFNRASYGYDWAKSVPLFTR